MNPYSKTYRDLHPIKLNVRKNTCWQDEPSADYPLGGNLEPFDIWRDNQLTN